MALARVRGTGPAAPVRRDYRWSGSWVRPGGVASIEGMFVLCWWLPLSKALTRSADSISGTWTVPEHLL